MVCALAGGCRRATGPVVTIQLDDVVVAKTVVGAKAVRLADVMPENGTDPATWRRLEATAPGGRFLALRQPAETYPGAEVRLYLENGKPAIGVFRPVKEGLPPEVAAIARQPSAYLVDVTEVFVRTRELPAATPSASALVVHVGDETADPISGTELGALTEHTGERKHARGWVLADVIELRVRPEKVVAVHVEAADGASRETVDRKLLGDATHTLLLKRNKKDELIFQHWKPDGGHSEVRPVGTIRIDVQKP